jgi:hypothetical protein
MHIHVDLDPDPDPKHCLKPKERDGERSVGQLYCLTLSDAGPLVLFNPL